MIGAGPSGSAVARDIAKAGFRVLLLEKQPRVGAQVLCSGLVSRRTLEVAGVSNGLVVNEIKSAAFRTSSGTTLKVGGDRVYALAINRGALDSTLARQAREAGADVVMGACLVDIVREGRHLRLSVAGVDGPCEIRTKLLVGADGVGSSVARWLGVKSEDGIVRALGGEGYLSGGEPDQVQVFLGNAVAPGWFGWVIPLGNGKVRVGTGNGNHSPLPARQLFNNLVETFPAQLEGLRLERTWVKAIPIYSPMRTYGENVLLVGDSARQVKPTSGGGIFTGLVCAKHCARVAVEALERDDFSESFLAEYETAWKGELGGELERGADLRRAFRALEDAEIDKLMRLLGNPVLQRVLSLFGDVDFPSLAMEQLVRAAPVVRRFLHVPLAFPSRWAADLPVAAAKDEASE